ncbi:hypothetical protein ACU8KH_03006 [Lachancea thermotolerans]
MCRYAGSVIYDIRYFQIRFQEVRETRSYIRRSKPPSRTLRQDAENPRLAEATKPRSFAINSKSEISFGVLLPKAVNWIEIEAWIFAEIGMACRIGNWFQRSAKSKNQTNHTACGP